MTRTYQTTFKINKRDCALNRRTDLWVSQKKETEKIQVTNDLIQNHNQKTPCQKGSVRKIILWTEVKK